MTFQIPDDTKAEIRALLEYRNIIDAIRTYRKATGCGLKEAKDAIDLFHERLRADDPERFGAIPATANAGSTWTLIAGVFALLTILWTVYGYFFPRFSGEPVSASAAIAVRPAWPELREQTVETELPDATKRFVSRDILLTASDFSKFRGSPGKDGVWRLTLKLSASGQDRLRGLNLDPDVKELVFFVHESSIAGSKLSEWSSDRVTLPLHGLSDSAATKLLSHLSN